MQKVKNLIVGCGLSGVVLAERIANVLKEEVLIIDARDHIAGNVFDYKDKNNITLHKYGPHVFHTNNKQVWDYLSEFTDWHQFFYKVKAFIDGREINIPFNLDTLHLVFPKKMAEKLEEKLIAQYGYNVKVPILEMMKSSDEDIVFVAKYAYKKIFEGYTLKQWGVRPEDLDPSVSARVPIFIGRDDRYFYDTYQAIPKDGYTKMVENIINHDLIKIKLNTTYKDVKDKIKCERLFYTGPIDEFFDYEYGELPYRSLQLKFVEFDQEYYQSCPQMNYCENFDYTRSVEYKYYLDEKSDKTVVSFEYPEDFKIGKNVRYYPVPHEKNKNLYEKYLNKAAELKDVYFLGRLGDYKYYNMDQAVERALEFFESKVKS